MPTRQQLLAQLNTAFLVRRADYSEVRLVLVEVADPAFAPEAGRPDCFRALFRGPARAPLGQDTYTVTNQGLGEFPVFLVPVGSRTAGQRFYEAAFNRVVPD